MGESPQLLRVRSASNEEQLCRSASVAYLRCPVADHHAPMLETIDRFVERARSLKEADWLHVHCEAGDGRTTMFLAMFQMIHAPDRRSLAEIVRQQKALGGIDLLDSRTDATWKDEYARGRAAFITDFHRYCLEQKGNGFALPFSRWLGAQSGRGPA